MSRHLALLLIALAGLLVFGATACDQPQCEISSHCPEGQVCNSDGQCNAQACSSSLECNIEEFCDFESGNCTAGCQNDRDCLPTSSCNTETRTCFEPGCRNTQLDCEFGTFCNNLTGECYDAGGAYCRQCESSADCGSANNVCLRLGGSNQTFCGVDCSGGQECPRGYSCARVRSLGDVTVGFQCIASCWEL
jgi:hypothetical protein